MSFSPEFKSQGHEIKNSKIHAYMWNDSIVNLALELCQIYFRSLDKDIGPPTVAHFWPSCSGGNDQETPNNRQGSVLPHRHRSLHQRNPTLSQVHTILQNIVCRKRNIHSNLRNSPTRPAPRPATWLPLGIHRGRRRGTNNRFRLPLSA